LIRISRHEWEYLSVDDVGGADSVTRASADGLVAAARASQLGGPDGEAILVHGHRRLRMQQVVGVLATPTTTLEILPKIDGMGDAGIRTNLVHMLARVFDLEIADAGLTELGWQHEDLLEILIRLFCDRLFQAVHRGLPRRYVHCEEELPRLRGRLDVVRQFSVLAATPQRLACRFDELSPDIPLNQIMKAAVLQLAKVARASSNQRRLSELSYAFADVTSLPVLHLPWDHVVLDRTNQSWKTLLGMAELLLGRRFQTTTAGNAQGFALLFEMNTLFEEYVGRVLRDALRPSGLEVRLQGPINHALISQAGQLRFATRPDIVISRGSEAVLIIDTKWKRLKALSDDPRLGVAQADVYQLMAYGQVYRCNRVMLLYPHHGGLGPDEGLLSDFGVKGADDMRLSFASIGLADLRSVGPRLTALTEGVLNGLHCTN
jgi:5-methylcytosine-specific restriction enzyme subunit McrC